MTTGAVPFYSHLFAVRIVPQLITSVSTILIVDDNPHDVFFLRCALEAVGTTVQLVSVANGHELLEYLGKYPAPDLLVVDFFLGSETGLEIVRQLRAEQKLQTPALMLSGSLDPSLEQMAEREEIVYREKPPSFDSWCELASHILHLAVRSRTIACAA